MLHSCNKIKEVQSMKRDVSMPQGKYRVGKDIPEGVYLIAALNDYSHI